MQDWGLMGRSWMWGCSPAARGTSHFHITATCRLPQGKVGKGAFQELGQVATVHQQH